MQEEKIFLNENEFAEYWINKGVMQAKENDEYIKLSKEKEEKFNMLVEITVPWQRKLVSQLIDDIKSLENERSAIEMDNTVKLFYKEKNK